MRLGVVLALLLAAVLSVTSTMAIETGSVTNKQTITVTSTNSALLALAPATGGGNTALTAYTQGGSLILDFTRGRNQLSGYAFPANTQGATRKPIIKYRGLFTVTNQSQSPQCVAVYVPTGSPAPADLNGIYLRTGAETNGLATGGAGGAPTSSCRTLNPTQTFLVDVEWAISTTDLNVGSFSFNVRVEGQR